MPGLGLGLPGSAAAGWRWLWRTAQGDGSELDMAVSGLHNAGLWRWKEFFFGGGVLRNGVGWHGPQPGRLLDQGFYRVGERLSKEPGWSVRGSRALQVMLCWYGGGKA